MVLKRIELNGFKSFADKTEILLSSGVTVVVGPNGSGKSNIADAVRWVLGEQSLRSLRGNKMEDVIFAGSDGRKPVGMAEVSITLDNALATLPVDYREVTLTRRVFRSGDSDYLLNRRPCRLKDFHELFADTGLGREGISIIGQGRVDEVLAARPEDRRALVEEAAGIVRYRNRKREATKKLEETQQAICRLGDLIQELEDRQKPLKAQAAAACRYQELQAEAKRWELGLLLLDWDVLTKKITRTRLDIAAICGELKAAEEQLNSLTTAEQAQSLVAAQAEDALAAARSAVQKEKERELTISGQLNVVRERREGLTTRVDLLTNQVEAATAALAGVAGRENERQLRYKTVAVELAVARREVVGRAEQGDLSREAIRQTEARIQELRQHLFDSAQQVAKLRTKIHEVEVKITRQETGIKRLTDEVTQTATRVAALEAEKAAGHKREETEQRELARIQAEQADVAAAKQRAVGTMVDLEDQLTQIMRRWQEVSARRKALETMVKNYQGYGAGVREVLGQIAAGNPQLTGVYGVVGELVEVPRGLETALAVALGGGLQNIVVADDAAAQRAIEHLKVTQKGRATFLPLKSLQVALGPGREILAQPGVVGCAADLVTYATKYDQAIRFLLGRTVVVENLKVAFMLAKRTGYRWRLVTLGGELLQPGGSVAGGSLNHQGGQVFLRRRELAILGEEEAGLGAVITGLKQQREEVAEEQARLEEQLVILAKRISELSFTKAGRDAEIARIEQMITQEQLRITGHTSELALLDEDRDHLVGERETLRQELQTEERNQLATEQELAARQDELACLRLSGEASRDELAGWQQQLARLEEEARGLAAGGSALEQEHTRLAAELATKEVGLRAAQAEVLECSVEIDRLEEEYTTAQRTLVAGQKELTGCREKMDAAGEKLRGLVAARQKAAEQVSGLRTRFHQLEITQARLDTEAKTLEDRFATWELTPSQATAQFDFPVERQAAQVALQEARQEMLALGPVNLLAIEEAAQLAERLMFLQGQHQDLLAAQEKLGQVIREIEAIMIRRFNAAFAAINTHFRDIFGSLFQGGQAELVLTDPASLLTTGVDIVAQPPGKKPVNLSLLSGGERALTAIALLFALLEVRPSPFCVLDEIEAALDDANVERFARYLQLLAGKSQIIMISHRKRTMEAADYLYGVTMEEAGVSKMVSVRLTDN
ncbi:MAG: chromosome segregation protein SMC [Heliobacteriaceae bacterium]|nr:chromosome segregation protein SMC [Heliobacteriaceae bacterium]MDD4587018.1 chromosome segregation protein SMC [Heliobacteriaceae bacterium]